MNEEDLIYRINELEVENAHIVHENERLNQKLWNIGKWCCDHDIPFPERDEP